MLIVKKYIGGLFPAVAFGGFKNSKIIICNATGVCYVSPWQELNLDLSCDLATQVRHTGKGVYLSAKLWLTPDSCRKTVLFSYEKCVYQILK